MTTLTRKALSRRKTPEEKKEIQRLEEEARRDMTEEEAKAQRESWGRQITLDTSETSETSTSDA